jgi:hypothetical protein
MNLWAAILAGVEHFEAAVAIEQALLLSINPGLGVL